MRRNLWKIFGLALLILAFHKTILPQLMADETPAASSVTSSTNAAPAVDNQPADAQDNDQPDFWFSDSYGRHGRHGPFPFIFPLSFFVFLLIVILSRQYFRAKTELSRIALLNSMVEKGQPIPDGWMNQVNDGRCEGHWGRRNNPARQLRRGIIFTMIGIAFLVVRYFEYSRGHGPFLILGIVFTCVGIGNLISLGMSRRYLEAESSRKVP